MIASEPAIEIATPEPELMALTAAIVEQNRLVLEMNARLLDAIARPLLKVKPAPGLQGADLQAARMMCGIDPGAGAPDG